MDSSKLNDWIQAVGIFAVVASLIFVGMQMKQSQDIAIAAQYQERYSVAMQFWQARMQVESIMRRSGEQSIEANGLPAGIENTIDPLEFGILVADVRQVLLIFDNQHFQYESGFLTDEAWQGYRRGLKAFITRPSYQYVLGLDNATFRDSFIEFCEALIAEAEAVPTTKPITPVK
jgi:hypothetical protein